MRQIYHNVCPADCPASCRILTEVENGRIVRIKGDPLDTYTQGTLCAKGYCYAQKVYAADRVLYPLKQREKGSGKWLRISWEEALTAIAHKLIAIRSEYGNYLPVCLDKYLGSNGILNKSVEGFFHGLGAVTLLIGSPCESAGTEALTLNYGRCQKPIPEDMQNSKLILIWGSNPAWTSPQQMRYIFKAQERGAQVVVIDPILTATAARSDLYYQIRPGTDGYLALGLAKVLIDEKLQDRQFLELHTFGWSEYLEYLTTIDLEQIATLTTIPSDDIRQLAILYGTAKPAAIWLGIGCQRALNAGQNVRAIDSLAALTGNIGKPGGNVHYVSYEQMTYAGDFSRLQLPPRFGGITLESSPHRLIGTGRFAELSTLKPPLELLWIAARNPVAQDPESNTIREVMKKIPLVVVADQFLTASAEFADYFLPVASPFEYEDVVISLWHYGVAMNEQAISPLGESKSDFSIMKNLAQIMEYLQPGSINFPTEREATEWLEQELSPQLYPELGITDYRQLRDRYYRVNLPAVPWQDYQFATPSGQYEFLSQVAKANGLEPLPIPARLLAAPQGYPLRFLAIRSYAALNSQFINIPYLKSLENKPVLCLHPFTASTNHIEQGDKVKVYNQLGELEFRANFTLTLPPDLVVTYLGITDNNREGINTLLSFTETDLGSVVFGCKGIAYANCFVNILKVG